MKILVIVPMPPPITGSSLAAKILYDELIKNNEIELVNYNKNDFRGGINSFERIIQIARVFKEIWQKKKYSNVIYITISQSVAGNLRDLFIYTICFRSLSKMIIHLHGGAGIRNILSNDKSWIYKINKFFTSRLGGVIVLGRSHLDIYSNMISHEKLHIVPNFAEDYLFLNEEEINIKFKKTAPIKILFLSNLIEGKGYDELVEAFLALDDKLKAMVEIDFAGGFESEVQKQLFLEKIQAFKQLKYHGIVLGVQKREVFKNAHIFCLPTYYAYEGQPISILEAYASGCFVITTNHSGINDVFQDGINGIEVQKRSIASLKAAIERVIEKSQELFLIALSNHEIANDKYRTTKYNSSLLEIIGNIK